MALPIDQTATLITTEALKQAGYPNPLSTLVSRAENEWLRRVLQGISKRAEIVLFEETKITILNAYQQRYSLPDDCDSIIEVVLYTGMNTGTLTAASSNSATLAADEDVSTNFANGKLLFITSGSAKNQAMRIVSYDESTKVANITPNFTISPSAGDSYMIANTEQIVSLAGMESISDAGDLGLPGRYHVYGKTPNKELYLDKAIQNTTTGAVKIRYSVYAFKVDLTDARLTWIYNELVEELTQGVLVEALRDKDDSRYINEFQVFQKYVADYIRKVNREKLLRMKMFQAY